MDRLFQDCAYEGTEWAFRATSMINKQNARIADLERQLTELREAVRKMFTLEAMPFPVVRYRDSEEKIKAQMSAIRKQTDEKIAARAEVEQLLKAETAALRAKLNDAETRISLLAQRRSRAMEFAAEKHARITDPERQLEELQEAVRAFLEIVRMPTSIEEYNARTEVEQLLNAWRDE